MSKWMKEAVSEATVGVAAGHGGPFGAVVVKDGAIVGPSPNVSTTAHSSFPAAFLCERFSGGRNTRMNARMVKKLTRPSCSRS